LLFYFIFICLTSLSLSVVLGAGSSELVRACPKCAAGQQTLRQTKRGQWMLGCDSCEDRSFLDSSISSVESEPNNAPCPRVKKRKKKKKEEEEKKKKKKKNAEINYFIFSFFLFLFLPFFFPFFFLCWVSVWFQPAAHHLQRCAHGADGRP
jgi:hypothetical protein